MGAFLCCWFDAQDKVLFQDKPSGVSLIQQGPNDRGDINVTLAKGGVKPFLDSVVVGEGTITNSLSNGKHHVFEVNVSHPIPVVFGKSHRVGSANPHVTGVEAEGNGGAGEHLLDVSPGFHHRASVRVDDGHHASLLGALGNTGQIIGHCLPVFFRHARPGGVIAIEPGVCCQHQHLCPGGDIGVELGVHFGKWVKTWVVEHDGNETTHSFHAVCCQRFAPAFGIFGQKAKGTKLCCFDTQRCHFGQDAISVHLVTPTGYFTHAPGNGCCCDTDITHDYLHSKGWAVGRYGLVCGQREPRGFPVPPGGRSLQCWRW